MRGGRGPAPWFVRPGFGDAPVGTVVAFAGNLGPPDFVGSPAASPPEPPAGTTWPIEAWGWMACDGRTLPVDDYPELFAALGTIYDTGGGGGDSSVPTTFTLPNYCGYFLRGIDVGKTTDKDDRVAAPGPDAIANGVGSTQLSALLTHDHEVPKYTAATPGQQGGADMGTPPAQNQVSGPPVDASGNALDPPVSTTETRPVNICVNYIIKFTSGLWPTLPIPGKRRTARAL